MRNIHRICKKRLQNISKYYIHLKQYKPIKNFSSRKNNNVIISNILRYEKCTAIIDPYKGLVFLQTQKCYSSVCRSLYSLTATNFNINLPFVSHNIFLAIVRESYFRILLAVTCVCIRSYLLPLHNYSLSTSTYLMYFGNVKTYINTLKYH